MDQVLQNALEENVKLLWHSKSKPFQASFRKSLSFIYIQRHSIKDREQEQVIADTFLIFNNIDFYTQQKVFDHYKVRRVAPYVYLIKRSISTYIETSYLINELVCDITEARASKQNTFACAERLQKRIEVLCERKIQSVLRIQKLTDKLGVCIKPIREYFNEDAY
tara:strand:- start:2144 stop:2638 length:495 start_codon:yes stop_codon:yes gene_type:complete